jgi:hypothetical protein
MGQLCAQAPTSFEDKEHTSLKILLDVIEYGRYHLSAG